MEMREFMAREKKLVEAEILTFMGIARECSPEDPLIRRAIDNLTEFTLRDGKRVRPILMIIGYLACGGDDPERIRKASISMELIQSMLLIHDDIMDRSEMRRGGPSYHMMFGSGPGNVDLGTSMGIIGGDLAESLAESAISGSGFPPGRCLKAVRAQAEMVRDTGYGQILDVSLSARRDVDESDIRLLQRYKTAVYTFDGPLRIGGILAGAGGSKLGSLRSYAIPVGISFQIIDDILGFFGDPKKGGGSDISDLKEGKSTLMVLDLLRRCPEKERGIMTDMIGSPDLDQADADWIRTMARSCGADAFSREAARSKVEAGIEALEGANLDPMMKGYLAQIARDLLIRA